MFGIALLLGVIYAYIFHKHIDINITILTVLVPIVNLSFVLLGSSKHVETAIMALKLTYMNGCFFLLFAMFLVFSICGVPLKPWIRATLMTVSGAVYATALTIGYSDIFYVGAPNIAFANGAAYLVDKHYGFMHTVFYVIVALYYLATITILIYSFIKKKQVSRSILILIVITLTISMIGFFGGRLFFKQFELLPLTNNIGITLYLIIASRLRMYDVSDSVIDSLVQKGETGFISFDSKLRYLGSNETAKKMIPELENLKIDHRISDKEMGEKLDSWIEEFKGDETHNKQYVNRNDRTYLITINKLQINHLFHHHHGYQFFITDDTANQQYIRLINSYNEELEEEVINKTRHILDMQDKLVLGMATMVEGRDNSTGGHIKRTSDCIRILVEEIKKNNIFNLDEKFCNNLIKAAPMHDLGKIAVDDAILRKPGRFTPEEFAQMKKHAPEGARIVKRILEGIDDVDFMNLAVNVAHYHHERWDGSGYPEGLKGEEIPLEARIMAIADVYDALVSKRVYKDSMSFEEANNIIMEGMGKHFDKKLEPYYVSARSKLEEYYSKIDC